LKLGQHACITYLGYCLILVVIIGQYGTIPFLGGSVILGIESQSTQTLLCASKIKLVNKNSFSHGWYTIIAAKFALWISNIWLKISSASLLRLALWNACAEHSNRSTLLLQLK